MHADYIFKLTRSCGIYYLARVYRYVQRGATIGDFDIWQGRNSSDQRFW